VVRRSSSAGSAATAWRALGVFFEELGFRPGRLFAFAAGAGETPHGLGLALGARSEVGGWTNLLLAWLDEH
jgi:uncharacterized membrane protein YphA (DoxX/SURF4 family)